MSEILYSTRPEDARVEAELRQWYRDNFGAEDARVLLEWLWDHNGKSGVRFVDALVHIARETQAHGKAFVYNLLDIAKKPKEVREAELEIIAWAKPRLERSAAQIQGHRGEESVKRAEMEAFIAALQEKLWKMWPGKHRATMKGAVLSSIVDRDGKVELRVADLVKALNMEDPLAVTAATAGRA